MMDETKKKALEAALTQLDKSYGKGTVMKLGDSSNLMKVETIPTGSLALDIALGQGGIPKGRVIEVYGPESCLDKDTFIPYELRTLDGERINHKGGTIEHLYERFHNICKDGRSNRIDYNNTVFYISSIDSDDRVIKQPIADVKKCGKKECFKIITKSGKEIVSTKNHNFYVGNGIYKTLENIKVGDSLYIHENINSTEQKYEETKYYKEKFVKYYPNGKQKVVNGCLYYREDISHLVYEANLNGYSYEDFINLLNNTENKEIIDKLIFIDKTKYDIHHKDLNPENNNLDNLQKLEKSEHYKMHALNNQKYMSYIVVEDEIISIEKVGERDTYDIKCYAPYNNYIANGIVVHNCGKTTLTLHMVAEVQKRGGVAAFIDAEHALDPVYAKNIGVNTDELYISQPDNGEQALEVCETMVRSGAIDIVVIDSVAALVPKAEIDGDMGDSHMGLQARLMSQGLRKLTGIMSKSNCTVIFINQLREKIGVMFGNPETTTGGRALKFYASVRLDVRRIESLKSAGEVTGNRTRVKVVKNKIAPPFKEAEYDIYFGQGIDKLGEIVDLGAKDDFIIKSGAWFSLPDGTKIGQGKVNAVEYLRQHPEVSETVEQQIRDKYLNVVPETDVEEAVVEEKPSKSKRVKED